MNVDIVTNCRYYVHFIISQKTRQIIQFAVTQFPVREFVRQQLVEFENTINRTVYMIHDHGRQLVSLPTGKLTTEQSDSSVKHSSDILTTTSKELKLQLEVPI